MHQVVLGFERRELHRQVGAFVDRRALALRANGVERLLIRFAVTLCVRPGARAFAQACRRSTATARPSSPSASSASSMVRPTTNSPPMMRMARRNGGTQHRRADPARQVLQPRGGFVASLRRRVDQLARQHQTPGGGIHPRGRRRSGMRRPVARRDLVGNQAVGRLVIGDAQQAFGQAHQRHAFLVGQRELLKERVQQRPLAGTGPSARNQRRRPSLGAGARIERETRSS